MQQRSFPFCVSCVCLSPLLYERDRSEAPNPNSAKTHTPTRRRRTPSLRQNLLNSKQTKPKFPSRLFANHKNEHQTS